MAVRSSEYKKEQLERFEERHKDDLSAGTYAKSIVGSLLTTLASIGAGAAAGFGAGSMMKSTSESYEVFGKTIRRPQAIWAGVGAAVGLIINGFVQGYKEWKENEAQRLATMDVNADITNAKILIPSDEELLTQNKDLKEILLKERERSGTPTTQIDTESVAMQDMIETQSQSVGVAG